MPPVIYHPGYRLYAFGNDHPFSPLRVDMLLDLLKTLGHDVQLIEPEPASREEIRAVHSEEYVRRVDALSEGSEVADCHEYGLSTPDTPSFPRMDEATRWLVGGTLSGARLISERGEKRVLQLGGGLHHAQRSLASGFCIYNDLAVAINWLTGRGLSVAYIDIDVHHGDGVQQILYDDTRVVTASFHESGKFLFPGSGNVHELGSGAARGLKLNVPLQPFTDGASYLDAFERVVPVALKRFQPDVLVVQAGADAHFDDPLADLMLTTRDYEAIFRRILEWADAYTGGRVLFTLGGGYSLLAVSRIWTILYLLMHDLPLPSELPPAWRSRWGVASSEAGPVPFHDPVRADADVPNRVEIAHRNRQMVERLFEAAAEYWT